MSVLMKKASAKKYDRGRFNQWAILYVPIGFVRCRIYNLLILARMITGCYPIMPFPAGALPVP